MGACLSVDDSSDDEIGCGPTARSRRKQRKRRIMEVLAAEAKNSELLFRMPGRMFLNGSSTNACIFTQQGRKGTNQDAMIVWESFASRADTTFCGVFDGHGPFGHLVAKKVRDSLPSKLAAFYKTQARHEMRVMPLASPTNGQEEATRSKVQAAVEVKMPGSENGQNIKMFSAWKDCFLKAYHAMDKELKSHPTIDCFCSGTTAVTMLLQGQDVVIANVGDSRAVLATLSEADNTKVDAIQLTVDLKPNLPLEAERIKRCKGRVFALEDEPEVARVWLPHDDSPGLAMARAFGDFCLKDFGLIAVPEVTYTRLTEKDQFIVLASDGVWDVLSNKEVVDTIWEAPTRITAARSLVETAVRAWRLKYPTSKVDDCAVVCFYLNKQQKWQAQAAASTCSVTEVEESRSTEAAEVVRAPHEFNRSNTLRSNVAEGVDEVKISMTQDGIVAGEDSFKTIEESSLTGNGDNADADGEDGSAFAADSLSTDVNLLDANVEETIQLPNNIHVGMIMAAAHETENANSPYPPPERSEIFNIPLPASHEEAPSEITELSDVGEDESGRTTGTPVMGRSSSRRSLAECLSVVDEDEWSALEGVARVNSLLNLPRFLGGDRRNPSFSFSKSSKGKGTAVVKKEAERRWR